MIWDGLPEKHYEDGHHWINYTSMGVQKETLMFWDCNTKTYTDFLGKKISYDKIANYGEYMGRVLSPSEIKRLFNVS